MKQHQPFLLLGTTPEGEVITIPIQAYPFLWVLGVSGSGKSTLLVWIILHLLRMGVTVLSLDPHGDTIRLALSCLSQSDFYPRGFDRLHFIDFNRKDAYPAFNVLRQEHLDNYRVSQNFLESIHRSFPSSSGTTANLDNTIEYSAFVLAENGLPITPYLQKFLLDSAFRARLLAKIKDQQIIQFFDFTFSDKVNSTLIASTMRRLDLLTFSPTLRNSLGASSNILNWRGMWDKGISCFISLSGLSESEKKLLGCNLLVSIEQHFLSRLELPIEKRSKIALIVDEAPLFLSQDETSLTTIIDQCRKAGAVATTFANQTLTQLSKGMSGSLQQALPVIFRAGSSDSSELANRFYRVPVEQNESWLDLLSLTPRPAPSIFSTVKNTQEARMLFEGLKTAEAIAMLPGRAVKIKTPTIPAKIDQKKLSEIENEYARRLLTPLTQIEREQTISHMAALSSAAGTDAELQAIFSLYGGYLTVAMVAKLLGKSENTARNKLKKLVPHILEQQSVPRLTPSGKTPTVFSLKKGTRKHEFLEHRIATAEILVNTALLSTVAHYTILEIQSDDTLKAAPLKLPHGNILVPDGSARLVSQNYEYTIFYEIDRSTESKEIITNKLTAYKTLASQCECMVVAFCVVEGGDLRVKTLKNWAADVLSFELRELFLFTTIDLDTLTPETLFLSPIWSSIGHTASQPLLEL